ncbi:MAG: carboxypeptidase-like regulatory domain-containing protein [Prolixibacteraceae bacterium]|nr:carboxypeptidase-like regulatory domain-containing protein [Prolixibacteraceae bacterium]
MKFRILLSFFFFCIALSTSAQGIRGKITNTQSEAVAFATIYVPELASGTTSNIDGIYELKLPEGKHKILFQYLGYQTQTRELLIGKAFQEVNIQLVYQNYQIPEIKVLASGEDPAYYIMRRAIAMAPYYQKQVSKYSCKVYLKGSGVFDKIPKLFEKQMKKDGVKENEAFVLETVSKIEFEQPDKLKQQVLAMRSSGKDNNTSPMGMITNNLYDAEKYGVVSPVGKNALKAYRFRLDGVFEDQGRTINKIRVIPKHETSDVFSGNIYIADGFWNIHSADLRLHIPMTNVNVHQVYGEVNKNTWMPVSLDFDMDVSGMGFKMKFRYVASISEYQTTLNSKLDHSFLDKVRNQQLAEQQIAEDFAAKEEKVREELTKSKAQQKIDALMQKNELNNRETAKLNRLIESEAQRAAGPEPLEIKSAIKVTQKQVNNDSAYWASLRPIPLTEAERISFGRKDSFLRVSVKPEYQDSVRNSKRKFKLKHLVVGKTYDYSIDSIRQYERFSIPSLQNPTLLSFNSVDGLRLELPFNYYKSDSLGRTTRFGPTLAYAFARKKVDAEFQWQHRLNGMRNSWMTLSAGTTTVDYNRTSGLNTLTNDFYTIWLEENYKRFYRRDFIQAMASRDLANGLNLNLALDYSRNKPLANHSNFSLIDYDSKEIQPNVPVNETLVPWQLEEHQSLIGRIALAYTPRYRYYIRNNTKQYAESKYPTFSLVYKMSLADLLGTDSQFSFLKVGVRQKIRFGIGDSFGYNINAGTFLSKSSLYFEDFQHFQAQPTEFTFNGQDNSFKLLPLYGNSTGQSFLEAHSMWTSRRFILKQLPLIKNSSLSESVSVGYLLTPQLKHYTEVSYGVRGLFLLLNVEAVAGFETGKFKSSGIRVSLNLNQ